MSPEERQLLERLANEGKAVALRDEDLALAKVLEADGFLFMIGFGHVGAVITPKGRRQLIELEHAKTNARKPIGFLD
jgi:hypothetical protein